MCWFIRVRVVLQKDTPHSRAKVAPLPPNCEPHDGEMTDFVLPKTMCGCGHVLRAGKDNEACGVIEPVTLTLGHYLSQEPVKRLEVWWSWGSASPKVPETEVRMPYAQFLEENRARRLRPDVRYRLNRPEKYAFN